MFSSRFDYRVMIFVDYRYMEEIDADSLNPEEEQNMMMSMYLPIVLNM